MERNVIQHRGPAGEIPPQFKLGVKIVLGLLVLLFFKSMVYSVPLESEAIRLRFGKVVEEGIQPGLHFKLPAFIDTVDIQPVKRQLKVEFGYNTPGATNEVQYGNPMENKVVSSMVTGDLNAVSVEWVVQYRIVNLKDYLYSVREPGETLRDAAESVMRGLVGDRTVDEVITIGRLEIETEALRKLQGMVNQYGLGMAIDLVQLKGVNPPLPVRPAFDAVNQAQQEREQLINVARGQYNGVIPKAKGQAQAQIAEAEGEALKRVNEAKGDAERFAAVYKAYQNSPDIMRQRLYLETMTKIIPKLGKKVILDADAKNVLPFLPLGESGTPARR
jgi:modulator of FtsH protease HflK